MSSETSHLVLRLEGPLQAWGSDSQYSRRNTGLIPTKSAIAGMCCAAHGFRRGSREEESFLAEFRVLSMTAIAIPRIPKKKSKAETNGKALTVRRLQDFHTVQNTKTAEGKMKDCHITNRQYLSDASFGVLFAGDAAFLEKLALALANPVWGMWLGRKCCIPSAPILAGIRESREDALKLLLGDAPLESFTRQVDVDTFAAGGDTLADVPVSFTSNRRLFSPRRVRTMQGDL